MASIEGDSGTRDYSDPATVRADIHDAILTSTRLANVVKSESERSKENRNRVSSLLLYGSAAAIAGLIAIFTSEATIDRGFALLSFCLFFSSAVMIFLQILTRELSTSLRLKTYVPMLKANGILLSALAKLELRAAYPDGNVPEEVSKSLRDREIELAQSAWIHDPVPNFSDVNAPPFEGDILENARKAIDKTAGVVEGPMWSSLALRLFQPGWWLLTVSSSLAFAVGVVFALLAVF